VVSSYCCVWNQILIRRINDQGEEEEEEDEVFPKDLRLSEYAQHD
jgi:hypothetical protein